MSGGNESHSIETPSGKDADYENFPVGSALLPAHLRPHVAIFYAFARTIDDIADSPDLDAKEKIDRLQGFDRELVAPTGRAGFEKATQMHTSLKETEVSDAHCRDLIRAFIQDAIKNRYDDWADLMGYCSLSAAPVGRYLIDLHGGANDGYESSDALCNALQVINHLQDCGEDFRKLDRVYIPKSILAECGAEIEELGYQQCSPAIRRAIDKCLVETASLVIDAYELPKNIPNRRLRLEAAVIVRLADALVWRLSSHDPLASRVVLSKMEAFFCLLRGVIGGLFFSR